MPQRPSLKTGIPVTIVIVFAMAAALPWLISATFIPLRPGALSLTGTTYRLTETGIAAYKATIQAEPLIDDSDSSSRPVARATENTKGAATTASPATTAVSDSAILGRSVFAASQPATDSAAIPTRQPEIGIVTRAPSATPAAPTPSGGQAMLCVCFTLTPALPAAASVTPGSTQLAAAVTASTSQVQGTPNLPVAATLTPRPVTIRMTNEEASSQALKRARDEAASENIRVNDVQVVFKPDQVEITGQIDVLGPAGIKVVSNSVKLVGTLQVKDEKLEIVTKTFSINGKDMTGSNEQKQLERLINSWLRGMLVGKRVQSFKLEDGLLTILALEIQ